MEIRGHFSCVVGPGVPPSRRVREKIEKHSEVCDMPHWRCCCWESNVFPGGGPVWIGTQLAEDGALGRAGGHVEEICLLS